MSKCHRRTLTLHGCVDTAYREACDDLFVLSSADFGHAYLSDGWATQHIQYLLQRFRIVFVGYSADDPPVQYLLEALNRFAKPERSLYAFHAGDEQQAQAQWAHKGVVPIAFGSDYSALWNTLKAWAERARDVDRWYDNVLQTASSGPDELKPHERGMVAHMASTVAGSQRLANSDGAIPASWLYVFDASVRYSKGGLIAGAGGEQVNYSPFDAFGLDSDIAPPPIDPEDYFSKIEVPDQAWDAFAVTKGDRVDLPESSVAKLRGAKAGEVTGLPLRMWSLGVWIANVSNQPAALWWAANQAGLHQGIQDQIRWAIQREGDRYTEPMRLGWRRLLAEWAQRPLDRDRVVHQLESEAKIAGWDSALVREYVDLYSPILNVRQTRASKPPAQREIERLEEVVSVQVRYQRPYVSLDLPDEVLGYAVQSFREKLAMAIRLEQDLAKDLHLHLDTIQAKDGEQLDEGGYGLTGHVIVFVKMMAKLALVDQGQARQEVAAWTSDDDLFTRLRIWAAGQASIMTPEEAGAILLGLQDKAFWKHNHQRDLLLSIRARWAELPRAVQVGLEDRLLRGDFGWDGAVERNEERNASMRLGRIQWLHQNGVAFGFDYDREVASLMSTAPGWREEFAEEVARPLISRPRSMSSDDSFEELTAAPLSQVLALAQELSKHDFYAATVRQPLRGLAKEKPARLLSALTATQEKNEVFLGAWSVLLHSETVGTRTRLLKAVGGRLAQLPEEQLARLADDVSVWLYSNAEQLLAVAPDTFVVVWEALLKILKATPSVERFPASNRDWVNESINRPAGRMVEALMKDPAIADKVDGGIPASWSPLLAGLLTLEGDDRAHAAANLAFQTTWLFQVDPKWTQEKLLPLASEAGVVGEAYWSGYVKGVRRVPGPELYRVIKEHLIGQASAPELNGDAARIFAGVLLFGWAGPADNEAGEVPQSLSDLEFREVLIHCDEKLRLQVLWYLEQECEKAGDAVEKLVTPFLEKVWPRQLSARTPATSARLIDIAFAAKQQFDKVLEAISPRLVRIAGAAPRLLGYQAEKLQSIADSFPAQLLGVLWTILPASSWDWPHETKKVLEMLEKKAEVKDDPRLLKLLRSGRRGRW